jgi:DNA repair protein RecO (recombination protein O)
MGDYTQVTGMVISSMPVGEYDRRIVLLTKERGKISAFAKGARKPNSPLVGITRAFVFGTFQVYEGRTSYNIKSASITSYFQEILTDFDAVCFAFYFAELADYYGRENLDASELVNLLYMSLKALVNPSIPNELVRCIYELRAVALNGEAPEFFLCHNCGKESGIDMYSMADYGVYCTDCHDMAKDGIIISQSTVYALQFIVTAKLTKLYTFNVSEEVLTELKMVCRRICTKIIDKTMKSEEMLPN